MSDNRETDAVDLRAGVVVDEIPTDGVLSARLGDEVVLLHRGEHGVTAVSGTCTHLGAPLAEGLVIDGAIRCPWHHACFDLATGRAERPPAFEPLRRFRVDIRGGRAFVEAVEDAGAAAPAVRRLASSESFVILGGGAAGFAAAHALREARFDGSITMVSDDSLPPYDRTLLTKDYLDGSFGDDRLPISRRTLDDLEVAMRTCTRARAIDVPGHRLRLENGDDVPFTKLLLATGAAPIRPEIPGATLPHVHLLRSVDDCRMFLGSALAARRIVILGGSFVGLEAAAALRDRDLEVHVVTPEQRPMAKVLGPQLADLIASVHRAHGTVLHLGRRLVEIRPRLAVLDDGTQLDADVVLVGIGVRPRTELAAEAGLTVDDGVIVDQWLQTSQSDIFAAGDIANWPDPHSGRRIRVEHWAVAERQGQAAAINMMGNRRPFDAVPFFWTKHFDLGLRYVGHAETWDELIVEGDVAGRDAAVRFRQGGREVAVATVQRDLESLRAEVRMEKRLRDASAGSQS